MAKSLFSGLMRADGVDGLSFDDEPFFLGNDAPDEKDDPETPDDLIEEDDDQEPIDSKNDEGDDEGDDEEDEEDDEPADEQAVQLKAFHNILVEKGYIDPIEDFDGSEDKLNEQFEELPSRLFLQAVEEVPAEMQNLLRYIFMNGEEADIEKVREFFSTNVDPLVELKGIDIEKEEDAYNYLYSRLEGTDYFPTATKLKTYLDGLVEDGSLLPTAEKHYKNELTKIEQAAAKQIEVAEIAKKEKLQKSKEFGAKIVKELDGLKWDKGLKDKVLVNLRPQEMQTIHSEIFKHPGALLQLSAFLTHFDPKTGAFDLSTFAKQVSTAKVEEERNKIKKGSISSHLSAKPSKTNQRGGRTLMESFVPIN